MVNFEQHRFVGLHDQGAVGHFVHYPGSADNPRFSGAAPAPGSAIFATPGVPIWPASHGNESLKTSIANGQSCLPGDATIAQAMPLARPSLHSELAASV